ncbi:MAG: hypothetical protein HZB65_01665 [Candidatus Aenigmarchaeota archaeon]|nr:hypothetical protein [Candidatus Aenigmarchaeota archaeon]
MGIAAGIIAAATIFFGTLIALSTGMGMTALEIWGSFHPGYSVSIFGSVVGLIYGFICWFVAGYVFGWLYNRLGSKSKK